MKINKLMIILGCALLTGCGATKDLESKDPNAQSITCTPAATAASTPTSIASQTETPTPTSVGTDDPETTDTPAPTLTSTPLPTSTATPEPTATETPTPEPTKVATPTPSPTPSPTPDAVKPGSSTVYTINKTWEFASFSKINTGSAVLYKTSAANPKNKTICVNAGHGTANGSSYSVLCHPDGSPKIVSGSTASGKTTATAIAYGTTMKDGTPEATVTKELALVLKEVLLKEGYNVLMIRESDNVALDNIARTVMANNLADCHLALHYDSTASDKGSFYMSVPKVDAYKNMYPVSVTWKENNRLGDSIMTAFKADGLKVFSAGYMEMDLVQMSYSTIPNIDLELGDTASSHNYSTYSKLAKGIVDGLNLYYQK